MAVWITDSQDEQSLEELLRDADQIHVPVFQRSYIWGVKQLEQLQNDIRLVRDGVEKSQFLGAVVAYERPRVHDVVGRLRALDVVDGQQRLLTIYIHVMALVELLAPIDRDLALETIREFLVLPSRRGLDVNTRLVPSFEDRAQFQELWHRLGGPTLLGNEILETVQPPPPSGNPEGALFQQYIRILRSIRPTLRGYADENSVVLKEILEVITRKLTFVHLRLSDPSAATKIFERLNYRGVRVDVVDLVRNDVFARVSNDSVEALRVYHSVWQPFQAEFGERAEAFFFPYCLIHDSNTKKTELFSELRRIWGDRDPRSIVEHMKPFQKTFLAVDRGQVAGLPDTIGHRIGRLNRMRRPSAIYPFVMRLLNEYSEGRLAEDAAASLLDVLESFLVRRAIVGIEPTGLHALFKDLWPAVQVAPTAEGMKAAIGTRSTIQWPSDDEFAASVRSRPLARTKIIDYLLVEREFSLPGDHPDAEPTIEHVLPQTMSAESAWAKVFGPDEHKELKDVWANLIPLSSPLNSSLQAGAYPIKRERYLAESMFVTPRIFAKSWTEWTPELLKIRGSEIAEWALKRWPH